MVTAVQRTPSFAQQFSEGLAQGAIPYVQQQVQRSLLQQALGKVRGQMQNPQATPLDLMLGAMEAGAGIPGSERYMGALLPLLMQKGIAEKIYGGGQGSQGAGSINTQGMQLPPAQATIPPKGEAAPPAQPAPYRGGVLPRVIPAEEMQEQSNQAALIAGNPDRYQQRFSELQAYNNAAEGAQQAARNRALEMGVNPQEIDEFMKIGQKYGGLDNLDKWVNSTKQEFKLYKNNKDKLQNAFIPKFWRGLISSPQEREKELHNLQPIVKEQIRLGFEPETRQFLADQGLSPIEVEEMIHPLSKQLEGRIKSLPSQSKEKYRAEDPFTGIPVGYSLSANEAEKMTNNLAPFFKKNVDEDTSLGVLRQALWEKNYPWEVIGPAIRQAEAEGLELTPQQQNEMTEIETQPPRQSLSDIFRDWWRAGEYIKGAK